MQPPFLELWEAETGPLLVHASGLITVPVDVQAATRGARLGCEYSSNVKLEA